MPISLEKNGMTAIRPGGLQGRKRKDIPSYLLRLGDARALGNVLIRGYFDYVVGLTGLLTYYVTKWM